MSDNPFFTESSLPLQFPPFDEIRNEHFGPAFERGMEEHRREIDEIAAGSEPPTFENVFVALERSGRLLNRVRLAFANLVGAHTNDDLEALRSEMAPRLAAHSDAILLNQALFDRIEAVRDQLDESDLDAESRRLVERFYTEFVRAGAKLSREDKERLKRMNGELAELMTRFSQNVLNEMNALAIVVDSAEELTGLSDGEISSAAFAAEERGLDGKFVLPLQNTTVQPMLASLEDRSLRQRIHEISLSRGSRGGDFDNLEIVSRVVRIRAERARLLGYDNHAAYVLDDETALTPEAVNARLTELTAPAVRNAEREASRLQDMIGAEGDDFQLEPWDWAYCSEKVRRAEYDLDQSELRPYLELNNVLERGVFYAASRLFGLSFEERFDLPTYHPDVRTFDVRDNDGEVLAIFVADLYARPEKRGGAWMSSYVRQSHLFDEKPVVANHQNVPKPPEGETTLLTFYEVNTMFHEFGHALHGMLSDVRYPYFAGTSVPRDFVEFPSQVNEIWAEWPEVLENYALHHETGERMPQEMIDKVLAMRRFNQGYATTEYLAASLIDQALHQLEPDDVPSADQLLDFEESVLLDAGVTLPAVPPRYRIPYFSHILSSYAAAYYSYIWAEVLDADAAEWFRENGGLRLENGTHFRSTVLSRGGSAESLSLYRDFRGRDARVEPLLERRGLLAS